MGSCACSAWLQGFFLPKIKGKREHKVEQLKEGAILTRVGALQAHGLKSQQQYICLPQRG